MKKNKVNVLVNIVLSAFLMCIISSCSVDAYPTTPTQWVVKGTMINNDSTSCYLVSPIEKGGDLNIKETWFVDSIGKFKAGDVLRFQSCHKE